MSEDWREGYRKAVFALALRKGTAVTSGRGYRTYSSWGDFVRTASIKEHLKNCALDMAKTSLVESAWEEFDGTFANPPWSEKHGMDVVGECVCGVLDDIHLRVTSSISDILNALLADDGA